MKKILIIFFIPLLFFSCKNNENTSNETSETVETLRNSLTNGHLLGSIKTIEESEYTPDENGAIGEMDSCCTELKEYNAAGFFTKLTEKTSTGQVSGINIMERTTSGKLKSNTWLEDGNVVWKRVFERDENEKPIRALDSDSSLQVTHRHEIAELNEYDQGLSGKSYLSDSTYWGTWSWEYKDGLVTGRSWKDSTNVQVVKRTGEVNDKGWLSKVVDVRISPEGDTTTTNETYSYDSFDETGNWTQRTELNDGKAVKVLKRSYTYYEK